MWHKSGLPRNIAFLELFPILIAVTVWAKAFTDRFVIFWSDNMAVVECINRQRASCPSVLRLLKHLVLLCLQLNVNFNARHVPGVFNNAADALSRFKMQEFRRYHPIAAEWMTECSEDLWGIGVRSCLS